MRSECPICREEHEPRGLSFDGKGVNSCGMYRTRLATFSKNAPEHLGPLFAAAPKLLVACKDMEQWFSAMIQAGKLRANVELDRIRDAIAEAEPQNAPEST